MGISHAAVESLEPSEQEIVKQALLTLARSGVIECQKKMELETLTVTASQQNDPDLATAIREYRRRCLFLDGLSELGQQYDGAEA